MTSVSRTYDQFCPVATTLDVIGDRWAMLVMRDLLWHGPLGYQEIADLNPGISPNLLTTRLGQLRQEELIDKVPTPAGRRSAVYKLTDRGKLIEPVVTAMYQFGLGMLATAPLTAGKIGYALMLAIRSKHPSIWDLDERHVRLQLDELTCVVALAPGRATIAPEDAAADAAIAMSAPAFVQLVAGLGGDEQIEIEGDTDAAAQLLALLPLAATVS